MCFLNMRGQSLNARDHPQRSNGSPQEFALGIPNKIQRANPVREKPDIPGFLNRLESEITVSGRCKNTLNFRLVMLNLMISAEI